MSLHNFPYLGHGSIDLCVEQSTCARCQVCTFLSVVLLRHERPAAAGFLFYGVLPHTAGMTRVCCQANILDFTRIVVPAFFAPKCRKALRIYHQERWKQKMKFRRKWKPGGHPRCSPQPYHRYRKKRLLNKPCIGYEAGEECIYGKRSVLRSANSCQHRRSAA